MSGIKQWSKNVEVQANPSKRMRLITADFSTLIGAGASKNIAIYSPPGYVSRVVGMFLAYPAIAAAISGTMTISVGNNLFSVGSARSAYNTLLKYEAGAWNAEATLMLPTDPTAISLLQQSLVFDELNPASFVFINQTTVPDGGIVKNIRLLVMDEKIA